MEPSTRSKVLIWAAVLCTLAFFLIPIIWFILLAIRPQDTAFADPPVVNFRPRLDSFDYTFSDPGNNRKQITNSIIVAGGAVLLNLPFATPAAYALSRFTMKAKKPIMLYYIGLLMAPPVVFLIPYFVLMGRLGIRGSYGSMVVIMQTVTLPFSVWLLKSFFDDVPPVLEEAAQVDGARPWRVFREVTLPLAVPGIIVTSMFAFVFSWNNAVFPLILSNQDTATLPVGSISYMANTGVVWGWIAATSVAAMLPPMVIFFVLDRWVVRGLAFGAVKG